MNLKILHSQNMNYDNLKNKYIGVRASRGGGIRTVHFGNEIDTSVILDEAKILFFEELQRAVVLI